MKILIGLLATMAVLAVMPSTAQAQRRGRGGTVNTPFGQFSTSDMMAAGGNPFAAEDIREQKMMILYQQQLMKQQQLYMQQMAKQQKAKQDYLKAHPEAAKAEAEAAAKTATKAKRKSTSSGKAKSSTAAGKTSTPDTSAAVKVPGAPKEPTKSK